MLVSPVSTCNRACGLRASGGSLEVRSPQFRCNNQTDKQTGTREGHNRHNRFFYIFFPKNQSPHGRINYHIISHSAVAVVIIICCHCVHVHTPHRHFFSLSFDLSDPRVPPPCSAGLTVARQLISCAIVAFTAMAHVFLRGSRITYADSRCSQI